MGYSCNKCPDEIPCYDCEIKALTAERDSLRKRVEELEGKAKMVDDLDYLRENEGAFVEIHCDNPEFDNSYDDCSIMIADDWTNDEELIIGGKNLADCLAKAAQMKRKANQPAPHEGEEG